MVQYPITLIFCRHAQFITLFDISYVFLNIFIFVVLTPIFFILGVVGPTFVRRIVSGDPPPPHKKYSRFFFSDHFGLNKIIITNFREFFLTKTGKNVKI